jgi:hypothetical protein
MTFTFIKPGRGAWSTDSASHGLYLRITPTSTNRAGFIRSPLGNEQMIGSAWARKTDVTFPSEVVFEAAKVVQRLVGAEPDGLIGDGTGLMIANAQSTHGLKRDAVFGPVTARALVTPIIEEAADEFNIPIADIGGIAVHESSMDPGAVGAVTGSDVSWFQINMNAAAAAKFTIAQVCDPVFASHFTAKGMAAFVKKWKPKVGEALARTGAIANHNSPLQAQKWMETGSPQAAFISQYVSDVRDAW